MIKRIEKSRTVVDACTAEECMELLRALSDETRQRIIGLFYAHKELCASDIARNFALSRPTISHHLNLMKRAKLLRTRKAGKEVYYSFNKDHVAEVMGTVLDSLKKCC